MFSGEIILDDLSFDILEALKNVDDYKEEKEEEEEKESTSKKRKTRNSYTTSRTREVVVDDDSDEEYTPPKVRDCDLKCSSNSINLIFPFLEIKAGSSVIDFDA